jgi:hypothetical protein
VLSVSLNGMGALRLKGIEGEFYQMTSSVKPPHTVILKWGYRASVPKITRT